MAHPVKRKEGCKKTNRAQLLDLKISKLPKYIKEMRIHGNLSFLLKEKQVARVPIAAMEARGDPINLRRSTHNLPSTFKSRNNSDGTLLQLSKYGVYMFKLDNLL